MSLLSRGENPEALVTELTDYRQCVPYFENMIAPGTWTTVGNATIQAVETATLRPLGPAVSGPALFVKSNSGSLFRQATEARDRAVDKSSYDDLQAAIALGLASVDGFINEAVESWNVANPERAVADFDSRRVTLKEKMKRWVPNTSRGKLDLGGPQWGAVAKLQKVRNEYTIHPRHAAFVMSAAEFCSQINMFRDGIASMLFGLHWAYQRAMPAVLINAKHWPSAVVQMDADGPTV